MTLASDNGQSLASKWSRETEPVRWVAHLSGVQLRIPFPDARTACFAKSALHEHPP